MTLNDARIAAEAKGHKLKTVGGITLDGKQKWVCTKCNVTAFVHLVRTGEIVQGLALKNICKGGKA